MPVSHRHPSLPGGSYECFFCTSTWTQCPASWLHGKGHLLPSLNSHGMFMCAQEYMHVCVGGYVLFCLQGSRTQPQPLSVTDPNVLIVAADNLPKPVSIALA